MKKLTLKNIDLSIKTAQNNAYFDHLNKIYRTVPQGECAGCTKCCMESVHTHYVEFLNIVQYLRHNRSLFEELFPKIITYYFLEMVKKEHCPFLDEEGLCAIYDVRPLVCRTFGHWTKEEYEQNYKNVLKENIQNVKTFKNKYQISLPSEVVDYKIEYCMDFESQRKLKKSQRQTMVDSIFSMESGFFMRGLIEEDFLNTGLVSWFIYTLFDMEKAGELRIQVMREFLKGGESATLDALLLKTKAHI